MSALPQLWPEQPVEDQSPHLIRFRRKRSDPHELTLADVWREFLRPQMVQPRSLGGRATDTIGEYETHLRRWGECWDVVRSQEAEKWKYRMTHPVLPEIGRTELDTFRAWLQQQVDDGKETWGNRTINKHLGTIHALLEAAVEHELLTAFPKLSPLPEVKAARKLHLSHAEADALKRACRVATWPSGLPAPAALYWETMVVGFCVYGFRTQEQARYESSKRELRWTDIRDEEETPHPDGKAKWRLGWTVYTPQKQGQKKPDPLVLPIVAAYHKHLQALRAFGVDPQTSVFPFPLSNEKFYETWRSIVAAAGVRPKPGLDGLQPEYQIRHLRKTATKWLNDHGAKIGCPGIAQHIVGHGDDRSPDREVDSKVSREHYDLAEDRILHALTTLPLPESFHEPLFVGRRQLVLF
jgi:hypothetical protein